jgi:hypothetical protein
MAREVNPIGINGVGCFDMLKNLKRIKPPPILPIEAIAPAVGRCSNEGPWLGLVGIGLTVSLDIGAVKGEDEAVFLLRIKFGGR